MSESEDDKYINLKQIVVHNEDLKVKDGIKFGFGFGLGMLIWGILLTAILVASMFFIGSIIAGGLKSNLNSFMGIDTSSAINNNQIKSDLNGIDIKNLPPSIQKMLIK